MACPKCQDYMGKCPYCGSPRPGPPKVVAALLTAAAFAAVFAPAPKWCWTAATAQGPQQCEYTRAACEKITKKKGGNCAVWFM